MRSRGRSQDPQTEKILFLMKRFVRAPFSGSTTRGVARISDWRGPGASEASFIWGSGGLLLAKI